MKLHFYGADQSVTGSCHYLEVNGKRILVDCGLQQGRDEVNNQELPFAAGSIDCVLVTGTANGGGHAWNQVKVDGKWYNIDVTWDDPIYYWGGTLTPILVYDYFLVSDSVIYADHIADNAMYICTESYPWEAPLPW